MSEYTISQVSDKTREYTDDYGDKKVYYVRLNEAEAETPSKAFELHKKAESNPPEPGQTLDVKRFQKGEFQGTPFVRIFQNYSGAPGSGGGQSGGDGGRFDRRPEHPRNEARMIHTSALSAAPAYITQMLSWDIIEKPKTEDDYWKLVSQVANRLARSYDPWLVIGGAQGAPEPASQPQQEIPAETEGLEPAAVGNGKSDDDIPF